MKKIINKGIQFRILERTTEQQQGELFLSAVWAKKKNYWDINEAHRDADRLSNIDPQSNIIYTVEEYEIIANILEAEKHEPDCNQSKALGDYYGNKSALCTCQAIKDKKSGTKIDKQEWLNAVEELEKLVVQFQREENKVKLVKDNLKDEMTLQDRPHHYKRK